MSSNPEYSEAALRMIADLAVFYADHGRDRALMALDQALATAEALIATGRGSVYDAPALDPVRRQEHPLRAPGRVWLLVAGYWVAFRGDTDPSTIIACFHERSSGVGPMSRSERA